MSKRFEQLEELSDRLGRVELQRHETLRAFETAIPAISKLDRDGCYIFANDEYARMLGRTPDEMIGIPWTVTVAPEDLSSVAECYSRMKAKGAASCEATGVRTDGSTFRKRVHLSDLRNGGSYYCFMQELTEDERDER